MAKTPLKQVIAEILDAADQSEHTFRKVYRIGVRACRKFNMDVYGSFKTVLLPVNSDHTVTYPDDYMDYSMIGVVNELGEMVPLKHNQDVVPFKQQFVSALGQTVQVPTVAGIFSGDLTNLNNYWLNFGFNGYGYIHLYGLAGGTATLGTFTVDDNSRCFLLNEDYPYTTILLEYLSDGYDCDGQDYMVDDRAVEAMQAWIRWMRAMDDTKKYSLAQVQLYQQHYLNQYRDAKARINRAVVSEMENVFRSKIKLVAKA